MSESSEFPPDPSSRPDSELSSRMMALLALGIVQVNVLRQLAAIN